MKNLLLGLVLFFGIVLVSFSQDIKHRKLSDVIESNGRQYEIVGLTYSPFELTLYEAFPSNAISKKQLPLSSILHYSTVSEVGSNGIFKFSTEEIENMKINNDLVYDFSHSILTNGMDYNDFTSQTITSYSLTYRPAITKLQFLTKNHVLIESNSGLFMLTLFSKKSPFNSVLTLLKESDYTGQDLSFFYGIESISGNKVFLKKIDYKTGKTVDNIVYHINFDINL